MKRAQLLLILVFILISCSQNGKILAGASLLETFRLGTPQFSYHAHISVSAGLEHKRSCLECVCALTTKIQDLLPFGCGEQGNCFTVHKCVHLSSFSMLKSRNTSQKLYVNRGATLEQKAGWNLTNLALGKCTISIGRNLVSVTPQSCIFTVSQLLGIVKNFGFVFMCQEIKLCNIFYLNMKLETDESKLCQ